MSARQVVLLGTASQVPTRSRNHNALMLLWDDLGVLFDPGEGTQRQMTFAGLSASQITHIAITHFHGDHCLGLAGIIQRLSLDGVPHPVEVFYPASGQVYSVRLFACPLEHGVDCYGYRLQEDDSRRMLPERLEAAGVRGPAIGELMRQG